MDDSNDPRRVTNSTGEVDSDGDIVGALMHRIGFVRGNPARGKLAGWECQCGEKFGTRHDASAHAQVRS